MGQSENPFTRQWFPIRFEHVVGPLGAFQHKPLQYICSWKVAMSRLVRKSKIINTFLAMRNYPINMSLGSKAVNSPLFLIDLYWFYMLRSLTASESLAMVTWTLGPRLKRPVRHVWVVPAFCFFLGGATGPTWGCSVNLGGGNFKHVFYFWPDPWGWWSNLMSIFFKWVESTN